MIRINIILKLKNLIILVLVWIGISHQGLIREKLSLSLRITEILKFYKLGFTRILSMKVNNSLILQKIVLKY